MKSTFLQGNHKNKDFHKNTCNSNREGQFIPYHEIETIPAAGKFVRPEWLDQI